MVHLKKAENRVMDKLYLPLHTSTENDRQVWKNSVVLCSTVAQYVTAEWCDASEVKPPCFVCHLHRNLLIAGCRQKDAIFTFPWMTADETGLLPSHKVSL